MLGYAAIWSQGAVMSAATQFVRSVPEADILHGERD